MSKLTVLALLLLLAPLSFAKPIVVKGHIRIADDFENQFVRAFEAEDGTQYLLRFRNRTMENYLKNLQEGDHLILTLDDLVPVLDVEFAAYQAVAIGAEKLGTDEDLLSPDEKKSGIRFVLLAEFEGLKRMSRSLVLERVIDLASRVWDDEIDLTPPSRFIEFFEAHLEPFPHRDTMAECQLVINPNGPLQSLIDAVEKLRRQLYNL